MFFPWLGPLFSQVLILTRRSSRPSFEKVHDLTPARPSLAKHNAKRCTFMYIVLPDQRPQPKHVWFDSKKKPSSWPGSLGTAHMGKYDGPFRREPHPHGAFAIPFRLSNWPFPAEKVQPQFLIKFSGLPRAFPQTRAFRRTVLRLMFERLRQIHPEKGTAKRSGSRQDQRAQSLRITAKCLRKQTY